MPENLVLVETRTFGPTGSEAGTVTSLPLLRDGRVVVGSFCFDREEWYGLFVSEGSNSELRCARVPRDLVTISMDSFLEPIAFAQQRIVALVQYLSVVPTFSSSCALVVYDARTDSWRVWRRAVRGVWSGSGSLVAWLGPTAIDVLDVESETLVGVVPISTDEKVDVVGCDERGTLVGYASGQAVTCLRRDGTLVARWVLPSRCWKLRFAESSSELFAFTRGGGLFHLQHSGRVVDLSARGSSCVEVDPTMRQGYFVEHSQLRKTDLQTGATIAVGVVADRSDFNIAIDLRANQVAVVDHFQQTVRVFRFS